MRIAKPTVSKARRLLLAAFLMAATGAAPAQTPCPAGQYQASPQGIPGPVTCAPVPHDRSGRVLPPPPAASHWGAIASEATGDHAASSSDLPTKQEAEAAALSSCRAVGGTGCSVAIAYGNGCGALVASEHGLAAGADVTVRFARQRATARCHEAGGQQCHVLYAACSNTSPHH